MIKRGEKKKKNFQTLQEKIFGKGKQKGEDGDGYVMDIQSIASSLIDFLGIRVISTDAPSA